MPLPRPILLLVAFSASLLCTASAADTQPHETSPLKKTATTRKPAPKKIPAEKTTLTPAPTPPGPLPEKVREWFDASTLQRLSLEEAIGLALTNNLDAKIEKTTVAAERARVQFEVGAFDPVFSAQATRESNRRPENINDLSTSQQALERDRIRAIRENTNELLAIQGLPRLSIEDTAIGIRSVNFDQQNERFSTSLIQRTPWGMRVGLFAEANRLYSTFSTNTAPVTAEYQTVAQIQLVQPLLKDFGPSANLANLRTARIAKRVSILNWKKQVMSSLQAVITSYFDMVYGVANVQVRQDAIAADEKLVQYNQRRLEVGFSQPFDVQQALAQVSLDKEQLLATKNVLLERQFALKRLILPAFQASDPRVFLPAKSRPLPLPPLDRSLWLQLAFANRPDFQSALADAEAQDVRLRFAKNQLLPQLDLVASYGLNGLSTTYSEGFNQSLTGHTPSWSVGLTFRVPLGNIQARAQRDLALAQKEQALLRIKQTELAIGVDIDTVLSRIETNRQSQETARNTRRLFEEAVRIGTRRLEEGQVSNFELVEQLRRLYDAKSRELAAEAELNRSISQLWLASGTILEKLGIQLPEEK